MISKDWVRKSFSWFLIVAFVAFVAGPRSVSSQSLSDPNQQNQMPSQAEWSSVNRLTGSSFGTKTDKGQQQQRQPQAPGSFQQGTVMGEGSQHGSLMYQVHVLGEVERPGTYRVPASTRMSEALQIAGDINERGSERHIEIRKQEGGGRRADLVSFRLFGNLDANPYLMDNDVVFVPLKQRVVQIEGVVKRPGMYELRTERTLEDLIKLAGGFTPGSGDASTIKVIRFQSGQRELIDVPNVAEERRQFQIASADVVIVPHFLTDDKTFDYNLARLPGDNQLFYPSYEERVFVLGAVARPGPYPFSPYYGVRQYLTIAGGTTKLAKPKKIKIISSVGKAEKVTDKTMVNPGDTIVVPEKYMAPENFATLVVGIAASVVGITSAVVTLAR